jgi:tetratricopeptide (TPR) repeat protein
VSRVCAALLVACLSTPVAASDGSSHLRAGAAHFRAGRYDEAVVEFKVARELGAGDECPWYIASALTRAGRHLDALEVFDQAEEVAPRSADALFLYYRGVACFETQLVVCAADSFELAARSAGPKVAEQASRLGLEARALLKAIPPNDAVQVLLAKSTEQANAGRPRLAKVFKREAASLERLIQAMDAGSARP